MKKYIIFALLTILLGSCSQQEEIVENPMLQQKIEEPYSGVAHDIWVKVLADRYGGYHKGKPNTRAEGDFSISPYIEEGDTLMYIVQYTNGWELYSASKATNMLIFSSEEGHFDANDPNMPDPLRNLIAQNLENIKAAKEMNNSEIHCTWNADIIKKTLNNSISNNYDNNNSLQSVDSDPRDENWILVGRELISEEITISPRLINTLWGQSEPWNSYSKYVIEGDQKYLAPAGCVPVAIAQYEYYTHFKDYVPSSALSAAMLNSDGLDFRFYGSSSEVWSKMATDKYSDETNRTAIFIGSIGRAVNANYKRRSTSTSETDYLKHLNKIYGTSFTRTSVSLAAIKSSIDNNYPLLSCAYFYSEGEKVGHMFLIDQYQIKKQTYKYTYSYEPSFAIGDGNDPGGNGVGDGFVDISIRKDIIRETIGVEHSYFIRMNWGWASEYYNNIWYNIYAPEWNAGYTFNVDHVIFSRSDIN